MPVNLIPEDQLRAALRPHRVDPGAFEAGVRQRLKAAESEHPGDPLADLSPLLQSVASFLPLQVLTGCKITGAAAKLAPAAGGYKLLGYLAFPAISLFVLLGATVLSVVKIQSMRNESGSGRTDERALPEAIGQWWRDHKWGALLVFAGTLVLSLIGATWLLFLFYVISLGLLLYVLTSLAKVGLGNRLVICQSCLMGLMFLAQLAAFPGIGDQDIHFLDQNLVAVVFYGGVLLLLPCIVGNFPIADRRFKRMPGWIACGLMAAVLVPLMAWFMNPILWPATPSRIKDYVESFDQAPFAGASWHPWEIVARWAIESKLDPDLSGPRRLLAEEIAGPQNPFVLTSAFRVGLVRVDQIEELSEYEKNLHGLLNDQYRVLETRPITSLEQQYWLIAAAALHNDLTSDQRDYLAKRLHAGLEELSKSPYDVLNEALVTTQLLEVIGRPVDRDQYRARVHDWLRKFHSKKGGGFEVAGGFKTYPNLPVGSLEATSHAVELMEVYGIPDDLDLNWVRSYLRPLSMIRRSPEKWVAAVTLDRLNRLPGITSPTWFQMVYYERSLLAAAVLVALCLFATLSSPKPKAMAAAAGSSQPEPPPIVNRQGN